MSDKEIIKMFKNGNSKNYIIAYIVKKSKNGTVKYTKLEAQEQVERALCAWWRKGE